MAHTTIFRVVLVNLLLQLQLVLANVPAVIVFGDSSVDTGNNNQIATVVKSNFEPYGRDYYGGKPTGRFSNGRVFTDFISEAFGIKLAMPAYLDPAHNMTDMATGVCFASAGTGYDNATSNVLSVVPLWKQLEYYKKYREELMDYLGQEKAETVLREALYIIGLGTNDFLENYYAVPGRSSEFSIEEYRNFLAGIAGGFVEALYGLGARKISLGGLPPMGCLPLERTRNLFFGGGCIEEYNNVAKEFNVKIQGLVSKLNDQLSGIQLVFSDPYDILSQIIQNPELFGFTNAKESCCGTGYFEMGYLCDKNNPFTCRDANKYVFWDSFHPTERTSGLVADHAVKTDLAGFLVP
ncbi:GDSL esterase/lipase At4g26790 [Eucalyptus grandis]|uniref:GDSL esterase/lipase At4g26790 n=1 Tax=Eucalyptus grandis TaxID=71139 RepID=UPI00192F1022|nr:GDSL esterase/lipase At4g26790 [Eucalyptus grandis]